MKRSDATAALSWANNTRATGDTRITSTELHVLIVIAGGCRTRAEIAAAVGCAESTVPRCVRKLVKIGALKRTPQDGKANVYEVKPRQIDTGIASDTGINTRRTTKTARITKAPPSNDTGANDDMALAVDNNDAPIRNAGARAAPEQITTQLSEFNPESPVCVGAPIVMPVGGANLDVDWALSEADRKFANERGFLNGSCDELFGQFLDHCATRGPRISTSWRSEWRRWVRNEVKFAAERARGANNSQGSNHVSTTRTSDASVRGERISPLTAARRKREAEWNADREPIDLGRVDSQRVG